MAKRERLSKDSGDPKPTRSWLEDNRRTLRSRSLEHPTHVEHDTGNGANGIVGPEADGPVGPSNPDEGFLRHRNLGGRPPGTPNRVTVALKTGIMLAAEEVGEDTNGKDGLVGYLKRLAIHEPAAFASLLRRIMPVQVKHESDPSSLLMQMLEASRARQQAIDNDKLIEHRPWKK